MTSPGTVAVQTPNMMVPMTFPQKVAYARELSASDLLPPKFRNNYASVLWAMEYGEALGLRGVVVISGIHVIEGKPAPSAAMAAGLIRSKGHRLRVWVEPPDEQHRAGRAVAELVRRDDPDFAFRAEWSVEDAIQAEICKVGEGKDAGKLLQFTQKNGWVVGNWQKFPRQMMKARALGEVCRDAATDVLFGLHYLAEELEGVELDRNGEVVSSGPAPTVTVEADPRPVTEHVVDVSALPDATPVTKDTNAAMMTFFRKAGVGSRSDVDKAKRLRVCEILCDTAFTPETGLTEADAQVVIDTLRLQGENVGTYVATLLATNEQESDDDAAGDEPEEEGVDNPR